MIAANLPGPDMKFHRTGENSYICLIDLKAFEVSTVNNDEGILRIELKRTAADRKLSEFLKEFGEQRQA